MTAQQQISSLKNLTSSRKLAGNGEVSSRHIFIMELEFVQCLSNPDYLQWLAKMKYFEQEEFVNYLKYLLYWKSPDYAVFLFYPQCLRILDALQDSQFRKKLSNNDAIVELKRQQSHQWIYCNKKYSDDDIMMTSFF